MISTDQTDALTRATAIADEVLFPAAPDVDTAERIPKSHLDLLAAEGFYGMAGPIAYGGMGMDMGQACMLIEELASGCLSTAFVWFQHHSTVVILSYSDNARLREEWLARMCSGQVRTGIAVNSARPGGSALRARAVDGGYRLDGVVAWVSGWGMVDLFRVAARDENDDVVYFLVDPVETDSMSPCRLDLIAGGASNTVRLTFTDHFVPAERVIGVEPGTQAVGGDVRASRFVGSLALGVAKRCAKLTGEASLADQVNARRSQLDAADEERMPAARAAASELAIRSATALVTVNGSRSVLPGTHAGRLAREALFLLVFASRPTIKASLIERLTATR